MTITLDLPDDLAAKLTALAEREYRTPEAQAAYLLKELLSWFKIDGTKAKATPSTDDAERAAFLHRSQRSNDDLPRFDDWTYPSPKPRYRLLDENGNPTATVSEGANSDRWPRKSGPVVEFRKDWP